MRKNIKYRFYDIYFMSQKYAILAILLALLFLVSYAYAAIPNDSNSAKSFNLLNENKQSNITITQSYLKSLESKILTNIKNSKIPLKYVMLPNFNPTDLNKPGALVHPGYAVAPAPMGLGFYGIVNQSGMLVGSNYTSPSYEATVSLSNLSDFNLVDDGPYSVTFQLNAVLHNVTLFGNSSYNFWTQNVVFYSARTHELTFLDNIWNFSSPAFYMSPNVFYEHGPNGNLEAPTFYYAIGPTFTVQYPFSLSLYLNSTLLNGRSAIFFNYSLTSNGKTISGSFDYAIFNSTYGLINYSAPAPTYLVSGNTITPTGFIPYDAEIMIGGPGGGSTADVLNINGTMSLKYWTSTGYINVPSAYDVGSETGETSTGVNVYYKTTGTAILTTGPSFVYGLWGMGNTTFYNYHGSIWPSNSFLFVTPGNQFNSSLAQWAPLTLQGSYNFYLPGNNYNASVMLSNYNPVSGNLSSMNGQFVKLTYNSSMGVYTPLMAMDNNQLNYITYYPPVQIPQSLYGTSYFPMVLFNNNVMLNPVFSMVNDYTFPVFPAVWLMNTNKYVIIENEPNFIIQPSLYTSLVYSFFGMPLYNSLGYWLYNTSNIELTGNFISGFYSKSLAGFPAADVIIWNSTNDVVFGNYFNVSDSALLLYNENMTMAGNVIAHNYFVANIMVYEPEYSTINMNSFTGGYPVAIYAFSSGNMIYDNYFSEPLLVFNYPYNIYNGFPALYYDFWNISSTKASQIGSYNGFNLSSSENIIGGQYVSGNYWWNYNGFLPFNESGLIYLGGDYSPEQFPYTLTVQETGLGSSPFWYGEVPNALYSTMFGYIPEFMVSTYSSIVFGVNNGTYEVMVGSPGYMVTQSFPIVRINGQSQTIYATFTPIEYAVTFIEQGLPAGQTWSLTVDGSTYTTTSSNITVMLPMGTYTYTYSSVNGYKLVNGTGTINVNMSGMMVTAMYVQVMYQVTFMESGLMSGTAWSVTFNGMTQTSSGTSISFMVPNGTYFYQVSNVNGYTTSNSQGLVSVNGNNITVSISYSPIPPAPSKYTVEFVEVGLPSNTTWSVTLNGQTLSTSSSSISFNEVNGVYTYTVGSVSGYVSNSTSGVVSVNGNNIVVTLYFHKATAPPSSPYTAQGIMVGFLFGFLLTIIVMAIALVAGRKRKE